jgi:hypothetical protein
VIYRVVTCGDPIEHVADEGAVYVDAGVDSAEARRSPREDPNEHEP